MPHDVATTNDRTAMAYVGELPWHRLGTPLEELANAAGLDYEVGLWPAEWYFD